MTLVIILAIGLLLALSGLAVEIGVASWNIRRAGRYRYRAQIAERATERAVRFQKEAESETATLDTYASKISWLLGFLSKRYDSFSDIEKEVADGVKDVEGISIEDANEKFMELKKALKIIRATVRVSGQVEALVTSFTSQAGEILQSLKDDDDDDGIADEDAEKQPEETADEQ
jgi:hypothetical protein